MNVSYWGWLDLRLNLIGFFLFKSLLWPPPMLSDSSCEDDDVVVGSTWLPMVLPPLLELTLSMVMFSEMLKDIESLLSKLVMDVTLSMEISSILT